MMANITNNYDLQHDFDDFVGQLLENSTKSFRRTKEYQLLQEKYDRMNQDCSTMFTPSEREFTEKCFDILAEAQAEQEQYIFKQGMLHCVMILKNLGVLS